MDTKEYADYEARVARFLNENHVKPGCYAPAVTHSGELVKADFSSRPCESCRRHWAGSRETHRFYQTDGNDFDAALCEDCVYYLAYGHLDDMTMLSIAESR